MWFKIYISETYLIIFLLFIIEKVKKTEEYTIEYNYTVKELYRIKKSNIFWKIVDKLACKINEIAKLYEKTVGKEYRRERERFSLSKAKKILHIGSGSYPISAIVLAEMDDVNITTIDDNAKAVKLANKVIKRKNLNGKIRVEQGDGTKYPLDGFDTFIISGCSFPKVKVLKHIIKDAKPQSKIIIRDSFLDIESIINGLNPPQDITIVEKIENHPFPTSRWESILITKNN